MPGTLGDVLQQLAPFLDISCRQVLLVVCKEFRQFAHLLCYTVPAKVDELIVRIQRFLLFECRKTGDVLDLSAPAGYQFATAYGLNCRIAPALRSQLRYYTGDELGTQLMTLAAQRYGHHFGVGVDPILYQPPIQKVDHFQRTSPTAKYNERLSLRNCSMIIIKNVITGAEVFLSTNESLSAKELFSCGPLLRFHIRPIQFACKRGTEKHKSQDCDWFGVDDALARIERKSGFPRFIQTTLYSSNPRMCRHLFKHLKCYASSVRQSGDMLLGSKCIVYNTLSNISNSEASIANSILVLTGASNLNSSLIGDLLDRFKNAGRAYIDIYVLTDSSYAFDSLFGNGFASMSTFGWLIEDMWLITAELRPGKGILPPWTDQVWKGLEASNGEWFDFCVGAPPTLPYRTRALRIANSDLETEMRYRVALINHDIVSDITHEPMQIVLSIVGRKREWTLRLDVAGHADKSHACKVDESLFAIHSFEQIFWILTLNQWHNYPGGFSARPGLYHPITSDEKIALSIARFERQKKDGQRDRSPKRNIREQLTRANPSPKRYSGSL